MADQYENNDFPQISSSSGDSDWQQSAHAPSSNAPRDDAPRNFASSSSFFSVKGKIVTREVFFPEKDQWLRFKAVTQAEYREAIEFCLTYDQRTKQRTPERDKDINIALFIVGAIDNDGERIFQLDSNTYKLFLTQPYAVVNRGADVISRISGIGDDVMGKLRRKNAFGETESDDES